MKTGYLGFAQIIHSVVSSVYTTAQFTFRLYHKDNKEDQTWTSTHLDDFVIKGANFYAKNLSVELIDDGNTYVLKSAVTEDSLVNLTVKKIAPGVIVGKDGKTFYGTDLTNPWGSMRHAFWPRNSVQGTIDLKNKNKKIELDGLSMFVTACQGMKPHHAAAAWNFLNFQSTEYSAVQMEFTTPNSYAKTKVNIGILVKGDKILSVSVDNTIKHLNNPADEVGWPVPKQIELDFDGVVATASDEEVKAKTAGQVKGKITGNLDGLVERVDVMGEIPGFVKTIAGAVSGTKPYIYQFANPLQLEITADGKTETAEGLSWTEVTFISPIN